jgi:hypothetical protein
MCGHTAALGDTRSRRECFCRFESGGLLIALEMLKGETRTSPAALRLAVALREEREVLISAYAENDRR